MCGCGGLLLCQTRENPIVTLEDFSSQGTRLHQTNLPFVITLTSMITTCVCVRYFLIRAFHIGFSTGHFCPRLATILYRGRWCGDPQKVKLILASPKERLTQPLALRNLSTANVHPSSAPAPLYWVSRPSSWLTCFSTGKFKIRAQGIMQIKA